MISTASLFPECKYWRHKMKSEEKEELISGLFVTGFTAILGYGLFSLLKYLARKELSKAIQENQPKKQPRILCRDL